jgi:hypothetical protein
MANGIVQVNKLKAVDFSAIQKKAVTLEEACLLEHSKKLALRLLKNIRKKRALILKAAEERGYSKGLILGQQEALRAFSKTTSEIRTFKKYLEQRCYNDVEETITTVLLERPESYKLITSKILKTIKSRIRHIPIIKVICHTSNKTVLEQFREDEKLNFIIDASAQEQKKSLICITPTGLLEIKIEEALSEEVKNSLKKLSGKSHDSN